MQTRTILGSISIGAILATIGAVGYLAASRSSAGVTPEVGAKPSWESYDWTAAEQRLRTIGQSLQIYRQHNGMLPVAQRQSHQDAGIAGEAVEVLTVSLTKQGKPWTISPTAFKAPSVAVRWNLETLSDFDFVAARRRFESPTEPTAEDLKEVWRTRGESVPILVDYNMHDTTKIKPTDGPLPLLVLRLDGTVDRIMANVKNRREILLEK